MAFIGRKTLRSSRARLARIDNHFKVVAQTIFVLYFLFFIAAWLSYRPSLRIDRVLIEGTHAIDPSGISMIVDDALHTKALWKIGRDNELLFPERSVLASITSRFPRVRTVTLSFDEAKTLRVTVDEYVPTYLFCPEPSVTDASSTTATEVSDLGHCSYADQDGYVFSDAPTYSGYPFLVFLHDEQASGPTVGSRIADAGTFGKVLAFVDGLKPMGLRAHEVHILPDGDVSIHTEEPWELLWSTTKDPDTSIKDLKLTLGSIDSKEHPDADLSSVDLRFGDKIFYK